MKLHPTLIYGQTPLFKQILPSQSGVDFVNEIEDDQHKNIIQYQSYYDGGGVAAADFNNDGLTDLFFTGNLSANKLYVNKGNLQFQDISSAAGIQSTTIKWTTGVTVVDINQDGWMDIYLCQSGNLKTENRKNKLYINNGNLTFTESALMYGLDRAGYSTQATFFDYDKDGDLDLFQANYGIVDANQDNDKAFKMREFSSPFNGDKLFENLGGYFSDVTSKSGIIDHAFGFAHAVSVGDVNQDGWDDIFVSNDFFEYDYLYLNNGDKTFTESSEKAFRHMSNYSMGNDLGDYNNDGLPDIITLDMVAADNKRLKENMGGMQKEAFDFFLENGFQHQYMFNCLQKNIGNGHFSEVGQIAGISNTDWSWAPLLADFNNDGWKDLYITNGIKRDARNSDAKIFFENLLKKAAKEGRTALTKEEWERALEAMPSVKLKNYFFLNNRDLTFSNHTENSGLNIPSFSNGAVYTDLDNDGDLDIVVNNVNDPAFIFENQSNRLKKGNYLKIDFKGSTQNRNGIGAKVWLYHPGQVQYQQYTYNHGFRSSMAVPLHFGIGELLKVDSLKVMWPDGSVEVKAGVAGNQLITLDIQDSENHSLSPQKTLGNSSFFSEVSTKKQINHISREEDYDDFIKEELLPHKMSALGPFMSSGDVNGDGLEDIFIGGAKGFPGTVYFQNALGSFEKQNTGVFIDHAFYEDIGNVFFDADTDGDLDLYVVSGGNELPRNDKSYLDRIYLNDGLGNFTYIQSALPENFTSGSVVVPHDIDEDGDLDLFVGGRQTPGLYPYPANSHILLNEEGRFIDATKDFCVELEELGMVTSAVWTDIDQDEDMDLIVAGEWMPVTVFENKNGQLNKKANQKNGLENSDGWWFSLVAKDMDGDGDEDLIAGNVGLNYKYKASNEKPFQVYSKDFDMNGENDIVLAYYEKTSLYPLRGRSCSSSQIPEIKKKFPTYKAFASASLADIYGGNELKMALNYKAYNFATTYFENDGKGNFKEKKLPNLAQLSSVNAIIPYDVNQDGHQDLVLAGNMYGSEIETPRNDAGYGLFLQGDGKGGFEAIDYKDSGLFLDGDVKDMKAIKVKGSIILLVSKNSDKIQMVEINSKIN
ncbi:VCBS repeat-containing protein [Flexithrix dorotheae]|uniref:VCBS repeat-containing protein n=1 Tax=Flexithrix dorotheae TaxID=70993 RepID=UPI00035E4D87|nr:VCBS repeat-containing protein [Flexithrix dorotheae]